MPTPDPTPPLSAAHPAITLQLKVPHASRESGVHSPTKENEFTISLRHPSKYTTLVEMLGRELSKKPERRELLQHKLKRLAAGRSAKVTPEVHPNLASVIWANSK